MMLSPQRKVLLECTSFFFPFRSTPAHNVVEEIERIASPSGDNGDDQEMNVLFMGCGDLRNALDAAGAKARAVQDCQKLHLHINDNSLPVIARNVIIVKIISCPEFDASKDDDMGYVWDIWYNATFPRSTVKRFTQDVRQLIESPLSTNIIIPKSSDLDDLKAIWTGWLFTIESSSVDHVLAERAKFMTKGWTRPSALKQELDASLDEASFSFAVDQATKYFEQCLLDSSETRHHSLSSSLKVKLVEEVKQYFKTGISGRCEFAQSSVNPTFLQPITGLWLVHYASCPFYGYLPIPLNVLDGIDHQNGAVLHRYCQEELKKSVMAFREQMEMVKFYFHPCDALVLSYDETFNTKFDLIDTSSLADYVGLANLLTAGSRLLLSDTSLLLTERVLYTFSDSIRSRYLLEVLCCPMSLIPTIYGLRLMDNIELGLELPRSSVCVSRLHWKRSLHFAGVQLNLSPVLDQVFNLLRAKCFRTSGARVTGVESYSPLTFFYVMSDLIHRGGDASLLTSSLLGLSPVFRKSIETIQAWMEERPVWRVKVVIPFTSTEQALYDELHAHYKPILRLVLIPISDLEKESTADYQFVDNIEVELKLKPSGLIHQAEISFLLEDRSLLETHSGMVIDQSTSAPLFMIGLFTDRQLEVDPFQRPFPSRPSSELPKVNAHLVAESCFESNRDYIIRLKVLDKDLLSPSSALNITAEKVQPWPCQSTHRIIVSSDGIKLLTITFPYPILSGYLTFTSRKSGTVDIKATKAIPFLWPEDCVRPVQFRWNPDDLEPWSDNEKLAFHLDSQFHQSHVLNPTGNQIDLSRVCEIIRDIFVNVGRGKVHFFVQGPEGSQDSDLSILAHPPVRFSPNGAPLLHLSVMDHHQAVLLDREQNDEDNSRRYEDFKRIFSGQVDGPVEFHLTTMEAVRFFNYVLSLNATKIQPSSWQKQNLPLEEPTPWLATFIRPLYREEQFSEKVVTMAQKMCSNCHKTSDSGMKRCADCEKAWYCSVDCQEAHRSAHMLNCNAQSEHTVKPEHFCSLL